MNILIVGLVIIAKKHIFAIKEIDKDANIYAIRSKKNASIISGVNNIYSLDDININFDFCIISNPTSEHFNSISKYIKLNIPLFIEKPSLKNLEGAYDLVKKINKKNITTYVALNLRFHPIIKFLKIYIKDKRVIEANIYCGSYLPDWRPNINYSKNYSAIENLGGGVHLDLIHEIDYSIWLFGVPSKSISVKKKISDLNIDSKDLAVYHLLYDDKIVNISLNYYRKYPKREIELVLDDEIIKADLLNNNIKNHKAEIIYSIDINKNYTYKEQMKYFYDLIKNNKKSISSFQDSLEILKICLK